MNKKFDVLGVKIDQVTMDQAIDQVVEWASQKTEDGRLKTESKYIVTPNVEFLMLAQKDQEFKKILNDADLAIPDSARLSWAYQITRTKSFLKKLLLWPTFFLPPNSHVRQFDIVTGTDLMDRLIEVSSEKGFAIGFLGGHEKLAESLAERLTKKYPKLKVSYANSEVRVDSQGNTFEVSNTKYQISSKVEKLRHPEALAEGSQDEPRDSSHSLGMTKSPHDLNTTLTANYQLPATDILFVALGQGKQEKWIAKNLNSQPVKVMIGVGGAIDYLSGAVPRAPKIMRNLGLEWLFRIVNQPWRAKRFLAIFEFLFLVLKKVK